MLEVTRKDLRNIKRTGFEILCAATLYKITIIIARSSAVDNTFPRRRRYMKKQRNYYENLYSDYPDVIASSFA